MGDQLGTNDLAREEWDQPGTNDLMRAKILPLYYIKLEYSTF